MGTAGYHSSFAFPVLYCPTSLPGQFTTGVEREERDWLTRITPPPERKAVRALGGVSSPSRRFCGPSLRGQVPSASITCVQFLEPEDGLFLDLHRYQQPWICRQAPFLCKSSLGSLQCSTERTFRLVSRMGIRKCLCRSICPQVFVMGTGWLCRWRPRGHSSAGRGPRCCWVTGNAGSSTKKSEEWKGPRKAPSASSRLTSCPFAVYQPGFT